MIGLGLGLIAVRGPAMLLLFPLLAGFLLAVTALTYQFQGWLAALMTNKRRRRTVIVVVTAAFVLLAQLPNLLNVIRPWNREQTGRPAAPLAQEREDLERSLASGQITPEQFEQRRAAIDRDYQTWTQEANRQALQQTEHVARLINLFLPPGWLPLGVMALAEGDVLPALLGTLGLGLIGALSLWRSYRTTVRLYTGQFTSGKKKAAAASLPARPAKRPVLLEKEIPWLSEYAAAIALAGFRSLTRAPEAKMVLLSPIILALVFGGMLLRQPMQLPEAARPLPAYGAMAMILLTLIQLVGNQFGFDRGGFRVFVLCAAPRSDILLGKNLAIAPLALGMGLLLVALLQVLAPMRLDFFLAVLPQLVSMFLLYCLLANLLSIFAPTAIAPGSLKPTGLKGIPLVLHLLFVFLFPLVLTPTLLPLAIQVIGRPFAEATPQVEEIAAIAAALQVALSPGTVGAFPASPSDSDARRWKAQARVEGLR